MHHAFLYAWLVTWVMVLGFLPPHNEATLATDALEVSGSEITYNASPVPFLFPANYSLAGIRAGLASSNPRRWSRDGLPGPSSKTTRKPAM